MSKKLLVWGLVFLAIALVAYTRILPGHFNLLFYPFILIPNLFSFLLVSIGLTKDFGVLGDPLSVPTIIISFFFGILVGKIYYSFKKENKIQ